MLNCNHPPGFQSTHSLRSATMNNLRLCHTKTVSIHALLAECDNHEHSNQITRRCFNPRTPCGVRPKSSRAGATSRGFQSTHSLRSATSDLARALDSGKVSIHALLAECDTPWQCGLSGRRCFNPRTPCGVRQGILLYSFGIFWLFQSTHSLRSATGGKWLFALSTDVSIHALLAECDL